nr:hypothetical protein [Micromonospora sp. DSM 115978]
MPSRLHETLSEMFREQPDLAAEMLSRTLGFTLPDYERANLSSAELNELLPAEYRADALVTLTDSG